MKIRSDFVSNSSSSSFIVAINGTYDISDFAKDVAKCTINSKTEYHNPKLLHLNKVNLEYCLNNFVLAFLGTLTYKTEEKVYTESEFKTEFEYLSYDPWEYMIKQIDLAKKQDAEEWIKKHYGRNFIDDDGKLHQFIDYETYLPVVDTNIMRYDFNRLYSDENRSDELYAKEDHAQFNHRIERLNKFAKQCDECSDFSNRSDTFQITLDTIRNTRDLLKSGATIDFANWENLDDIEKRLCEGQKIFCIRNNYQGDGYSNYAIYSEDDSEGFDSIAMEYVGSID